MPIVNTDLKFHLSGGAANADPNASLGDAISANELGASLHNLFDVVRGDEALAGDTEYRCFYVKNNHGTLNALYSEIWVESESPSADTDEEIAIGSSGIGGTEQAVVDESTPPAGVTFGQANGEANSLSIGDIPAGSYIAIWVKRIVSPGAAAYNDDGPTIRVKCETAA